MSQSRQDSHWPKMGQFEHQKGLHIQYVKIYKITAMLLKKQKCARVGGGEFREGVPER